MNNKHHKFFEKYLDNDLNILSGFLKKKYEEIKNIEVSGVSELNKNGPEFWTESGSIATVKWREYNVFQFHNPEIFNVYKGVSELIKEACNYYEINFDNQKFMVQGWFNINFSDTGKLNWHEHGPSGAPNFHGYYCINAEPSTTHYRIFNRDDMLFDNINKNNRMVISEMGHPHAMGDWKWDGPRITLAYDIMPLNTLIKTNAPEQHWIPLC